MTWLAETAMLSHGWRRFLLLLVAGAIAGLSVPPFFLLPALFLAMPVWVWALDGAERGSGWRRLFGPAFGIGFAFGLGYFLVAFHWLGAAFFVDGGLGPGRHAPGDPGALGADRPLLGHGERPGASHLGPRRQPHPGADELAGRGRIRPRPRADRFPFDLLGYSLTGNDEMMQLASVIGVYGLTFLAPLSP